MDFTYYFPRWLGSRALVVSGISQGLSGVGASWTIAMPIVIPGSDPIWHAAKNGNIAYLQHQFSQGRVTPFVINSDGVSLLLVCSVLLTPRVGSLIFPT